MLVRAALRSSHGAPSRALCRARECRARVNASADASSSFSAGHAHSGPASPPPAPLSGDATFVSRTSRCTEQVAEALAREARVGDVVCLHGDVGAGKSVLSRAFVRAVTDDQSTEVPSPTFLLQQVYDNENVPVHHFDLYRLSDVRQTVKLDLQNSYATAVSLIEWAERLGDAVPENRLDVFLTIATDDAVVASLENGGHDVLCDETTDSADADADADADDFDPAFVDSQPRLIRVEGKGVYWQARVATLRDAFNGDAPKDVFRDT